MSETDSPESAGGGQVTGQARATAALPLAPYFEIGPEELRAALNNLVGFDVAATVGRFGRWLVDRQYASYVEPNDDDSSRKWVDELSRRLGHRPITDVHVPDATAENAANVKKARALLEEMHGPLSTLESMYGPERLAEKRWRDALAALGSALRVFLPAADVRERENSYFASKMVTASPGMDRPADKALVLTAEIRMAATALEVKVGDARRGIGGYRDDPLPGVEGGRPNKRYLAEMEARLWLAGFGPAEIAKLVVEGQRAASGNSASAQVQHRDRIESRINARKPAIVRSRRNNERAEASIDAFMEKHGGRRQRTSEETKQLLLQWLTSPEAEALESEDTEGGEEDAGG